MLTDDKTYPFIKVTLQEEYPRIQIVRQMKKDKADGRSSGAAIEKFLDEVKPIKN